MSKDARFSFYDANRPVTRAFAVWATGLAISLCFLSAKNIEATEYLTPNFIIRNAPNQDLARQFGETAERCRKDMAILWLGTELPRWSAPCPIQVKVGNYGAGGETSMHFDKGEVFDWDMRIQGTADSILTAVLPHEITHMILASHFREPVPRWVDEGAATFVENEKERQNYRRLLYQYLRTGRGIPFNQMFRMGKYPDDQMPLYAQGFSLAEFLILLQGHRHYVDFAGAGMKTNNWPQAICDYYGYENLGELQVKWNRWVDAGCPDLTQLPQDQPIFVSDTTQYVASRDFMPMRQPVILARATRATTTADQFAGQGIAHASWEGALSTNNDQNTQNAATVMQPEREPIRLSLAQSQQNQPLAANFAPIPESADNTQYGGYDVPRAIPAQPVGKQTVEHFAAQPVEAPSAMSSVIARPVSPQVNAVSTAENRLPSYYSENQPQAAVTVHGQESASTQYPHTDDRQAYQSSRSMSTPTQTDDSRVIYDWRIR